MDIKKEEANKHTVDVIYVSRPIKFVIYLPVYYVEGDWWLAVPRVSEPHWKQLMC